VAAKSVPAKNLRPIWILTILLLVLFSAVFVGSGAQKAMKMQTETANKNQFARLKPGDAAKIVIEVSATNGGKISGKLLERLNDTHYKPTEKQTQVNWNAGTSIAMGKASDVRSGAVLHVTGTVAADHTVEAQQIVILTGYVEVK
jgi:hypothetical protein